MPPGTSLQIDKKVLAEQIAERLLAADPDTEAYYRTDSREEYDLLFEAASRGWLSRALTLGRSGLWLNKLPVHPPRTVPN